MIGKHQIVIDSSDFIKGMSSGSDISDGGFSNKTDAVNLTAVPGVLYASASGVNSDTDARLTGNVIASSPDMATLAASNRLLVTDDDKFYRYNGTKITAAGYTGGTASTNAAGFTDIVTYRGEAYVSSKERIKRWQDNNTITDLGSFTTSNVPHPMIVYANNMYAADANLLLRTVSVTVMPTTILTLESGQIIMALGIDPGTGLMLISTTSTVDTSGTLPAINKLIWYNGSDGITVKEVIIEDCIYGFHTVGGTTFVGIGKNLGYVNGSGTSFLRKLNNVTNVQAELPYKHHFAHVGNTLYVLDGLQILAYGEILPGSKKPYYCFQNNVNSNKIISLGDGGNGKLVYGFATSKFYSFDTTSVSTTAGLSLFTNDYNFPRPITLLGAYIEYSTAIVANDDNRSLYYQSEDGQLGYQILRVQGQVGTGGLKNTSASSVYFIDNIIGFSPNKVRSIKFRYLTSAVNSGLKRIILYYNVAE